MEDDSDFKTVIAAEQPAVPGQGKNDKAFLILLSGSGVGEVFALHETQILGRGQQAELRVRGEGISRQHAKLISLEGAVVLEDLGSTNGTYLNGERVSRAVLKDGDKIQVGDSVILKFSCTDEFEEDFQRQMYQSASRDGLTRIFNKRYFLDQLDLEFSYARRHGVPLALILFDLDRFKAINDSHGHAAGDLVLVTLAERVERVIRSEDVFARYGGEEFVVLSRGTGLDSAQPLAERIRRAVADQEFVFQERSLPVTVSIGVAALPHPEIGNREDLVAAADKALYRAKRGGRNQVVLYREKSDEDQPVEAEAAGAREEKK